MIATQEFVVPRSIPITLPFALSNRHAVALRKVLWPPVKETWLLFATAFIEEGRIILERAMFQTTKMR